MKNKSDSSTNSSQSAVSAQSHFKNKLHEKCEECPTKSKGFLCSTSEEINEVISKIKVNCSYKAGEFIFHAGTNPLGLFAVKSGAVKIEHLSPEGDAHTVRLVGGGGLLGYRSFFSGEKYNSSAIALENTDVCFLPKSEILNLFMCHPELSLKMINHLSQDLKSAENKWMSQIDNDSSARIAEALLFLDEKFREVQWTRKEIAEWAGSTTETVIRVLAQFEKDGLISQNYKNFTILDKKRLIEKIHQI